MLGHSIGLAPQRGLEPRTLSWINRCTDGIDPWNYICAIDDFLKRGRQHGWLEIDGELFVLGSITPRGSLSGFKNVVNYADVTIVGDITFIPLLGAVRTDPSENSYIDLNIKPLEVSGLTLNSHSIGAYLTSNFIGPWNIMGCTGTGGLKSFNIVTGAGFRQGARLGADQFIFGDSLAWGWTFGTRQDANTVACFRHKTRTGGASTAVSLPDADITLLSSEPGVGNDPNTQLIAWFGAGMSDELAAAFAADVDRLSMTLGIKADIAVPPIVLGENCFGPSALNDITPSSKRIYRQGAFPSQNGLPAASYNFYPITDSIVRSFTETTTTEDMPADPVETFSGEGRVRFTRVAHGASVKDVIRCAGLEATGGILPADLNRRHLITVIVDPDTVEVEIDGASASSSTTGGGAAAVSTLTRWIAPTSEFVPPRSGRFWHLAWSCRGERDELGGPITSPTLKGNDSYGPLLRITDAPGGGPLAGSQCRPVYTTKQRGAGATLVHIAHALGYAARDEARDPYNQGYLDIAEAYDLDPDKCQVKGYFVANSEELFTTALVGYAVVYDYVILTPRTLVEAMPHLTMAQKGVCIDCEHSDNRSSALNEAMWTRVSEIAVAVGSKISELGHYKSHGHLIRNGFQDGVLARVVALPGIESLNLLITQNVPDFMANILDQAENFRSAITGLIPYGKILASCTTGPGKNRIDDEGPLGPQQVTLENCALAADWMNDNGVVHCHVRRAGQTEGGEVERVPNQQMIEYFPSLGGVEVDDTAIAQVSAWETAVINAGGTVSGDRFGLLVELVQALMDAGVWAKYDELQIYAGENEYQALMSLKRRIAPTLHGTSNPTFVANEGYQFSGAGDNNYLRTGFTPSSDAVVMTGSDMRLAVYSLTNLAENTNTIVGCLNNSTSQNLAINPRTFGGLIQGRANSAQGTTVGTVATSVGLTAVQRTAAPVFSIWKNGALFETYSPGTSGTTLPSREVYVGCINNNGSPANFRASKVPLVVLGGSLDSTQAAAEYTAFQTFLTAIGAI